MKITSYGAAHQVTGSSHVLESDSLTILFDCGLFQGSKETAEQNDGTFPFDPKAVDVLLVSHAHLDHVGRIPKLVKEGFTGSIYMTKPTCELAPLIWEDNYRIMLERNHKMKTPMLYDKEDIAAAKLACRGIEYGEPVDIDGATAVFKDVGHIFGSAFIEVDIDGKRIAYSGDLGNDNVPILRDTEQLGSVDVLICESTYGNREHGNAVRSDVILDLLEQAFARGGAIMVPAFSLERTQEFLYELNTMIENQHKLAGLPVFLDSPLAIDAMPVYRKYPQYYDKEALAKYDMGDDFMDFPGLTVTRTVEQSKTINHVPNPKMIIAGSGMMTGGRILHHLIKYLPDPNSTLLIVGYQAEGTLGRRLVEGEKRVKIFHEEVDVKCHIESIRMLSAHGDKAKIKRWIGEAAEKPKQVIFVHGEQDAAEEIAKEVESELGVNAHVQVPGEAFEID